MNVNPGIFKAYDVRGVYPGEINEEVTGEIGRAFVTYLGARRIGVSRDMRLSSPTLAAAFIEGAVAQGCDVVDYGMLATDMLYFAVASEGLEGGAQITASHNPGEYNGMKLCGPGAQPISAKNGILAIEAMCAEAYPQPKSRRGGLEEIDLLQDYAAHVARFASLESGMRIAIDAANGMAGHTLPAILEILFGGAGVKAPTAFPRADLVAAFLTGVPGLNANGSVAEMLRLNTDTLPTPAASQSNLGVIGGDAAGFPNGRRPGDDVVDIELRVAMGKLLSPADAPSGQLDFTDGALVDASRFSTSFPYLRTPLPGSPNATP